MLCFSRELEPKVKESCKREMSDLLYERRDIRELVYRRRGNQNFVYRSTEK